jgi:hypothetical protein
MQRINAGSSSTENVPVITKTNLEFIRKKAGLVSDKTMSLILSQLPQLKEAISVQDLLASTKGMVEDRDILDTELRHFFKSINKSRSTDEFDNKFRRMLERRNPITIFFDILILAINTLIIFGVCGVLFHIIILIPLIIINAYRLMRLEEFFILIHDNYCTKNNDTITNEDRHRLKGEQCSLLAKTMKQETHWLILSGGFLVIHSIVIVIRIFEQATTNVFLVIQMLILIYSMIPFSSIMEEWKEIRK